jgi:hypothetical protein
MFDALMGMRLDEAVVLLKAAGIEPIIEYADPPFLSFDRSGRTPRVVLFKDGTLLVSNFRDSVPEA